MRAAHLALALPQAVGLDLRIASLDRVRSALGGQDPGLRADVGQALAIALHRLGDTHAALVAQGDTLADAQEAGDEWRAVLAECWGALIASRMGAHREADTLLHNAGVRAARCDDLHVGLVSGMVGYRDLEEGHPTRAERQLAIAVECFGEAAQPVPADAARVARARALARCARIEEAASELALPLGRLSVQPHDLLAIAFDAYAEIASLAGRSAGSEMAVVVATRIRRQVGLPRQPHEAEAVVRCRTARAEHVAAPCSAADACAEAAATLASIAG